jgi:GT2 family glycosyltransferase
MTVHQECSPPFSLIFLTWNSARDIERTLDSVLAQSYEEYEVIIVDNNSGDETVSLIEKEYLHDDRFHLIQNDNNLRFTRGINRGIEASIGKYIGCYNDDTYFPPEYLSTLANTLTPDSVWTTARINYRVSKHYQCVRLLGRFGFPIPYIVDDRSGVLNVNYVPGDGLIVPREVYNKTLNQEVFRPSMPDKAEDIDLSLRLRKSNTQIKAILDTHSVHPDEGFYALEFSNLIKHFINVYNRSIAYLANGKFFKLPGIILSLIGIPLVILTGTFPRSSDSLERHLR